MLKTIAVLGIVVLTFALHRAPVYTAPTGTHTLYAPMVSRAVPPLPNEPLLLVAQDTPNSNLAWVNSNGTFRTQLTNAENNDSAMVSPDGNQIIYFQQRANDPSRYLLLDARGGTPREMLLGNLPLMINWSSDMRYLFYGRSVGEEQVALFTYELATDRERVVSQDTNGYVRWHPQLGGLVYGAVRDGNYGLYHNTVDGMAETLMWQSQADPTIYAILPDSRIVVGQVVGEMREIGMINADGSGYSVLRRLAIANGTVRVSPTGSGIFYFDSTSNTVIVEDFAGNVLVRRPQSCNAPFETCTLHEMTWRADGQALAFIWDQEDMDGPDEMRLYHQSLDGSATQLVESYPFIITPRYSVAGEYLAYRYGNDMKIWDVETATPHSTIMAPGDGQTRMVGWRAAQ